MRRTRTRWISRTARQEGTQDDARKSKFLFRNVITSKRKASRRSAIEPSRPKEASKRRPTIFLRRTRQRTSPLTDHSEAAESAATSHFSTAFSPSSTKDQNVHLEGAGKAHKRAVSHPRTPVRPQRVSQVCTRCFAQAKGQQRQQKRGPSWSKQSGSKQRAKQLVLCELLHDPVEISTTHHTYIVGFAKKYTFTQSKALGGLVWTVRE